MNLPIGMLIYKAQRLSDTNATITGIWYFQEMYVPRTKEEKIQSWEDLKKRRCTGIIISRTYDQICEIIMQSDAYAAAGDREIDAYTRVLKKLETSTEQYVFDEFTAIKGTALSVDTSIEVEDDFEQIRLKINAWKMVEVQISQTSSFFDFLKSHR